jgi:hypothetical protein
MNNQYFKFCNLNFRAKEIDRIKTKLPAKYHEQMDAYLTCGKAMQCHEKIEWLAEFFKSVEQSKGKKKKHDNYLYGMDPAEGGGQSSTSSS